MRVFHKNMYMHRVTSFFRVSLSNKMFHFCTNWMKTFWKLLLNEVVFFSYWAVLNLLLCYIIMLLLCKERKGRIKEELVEDKLVKSGVYLMVVLGSLKVLWPTGAANGLTLIYVVMRYTKITSPTAEMLLHTVTLK